MYLLADKLTKTNWKKITIFTVTTDGYNKAC